MLTKNHGAELRETHKNVLLVPKETLKPMYLTTMIHDNICNLFPTSLPPDFCSLTYICKSDKMEAERIFGRYHCTAVFCCSLDVHHWPLWRMGWWAKQTFGLTAFMFLCYCKFENSLFAQASLLLINSWLHTHWHAPAVWGPNSYIIPELLATMPRTESKEVVLEYINVRRYAQRDWMITDIRKIWQLEQHFKAIKD